MRAGTLGACSLGAVLLLAVGRGALAQQDEDAYEAPERSVTLDAPTRARLGIRTRTAQAVQYQPEARGIGQVVGVDAIAQTDADLRIADAAVRASAAALTRARGLYGADNATSRQALETAEHQAAADQAQLELAERKSAAIWGREAPWQDAKHGSALMAKLVSGAAVLVRATFPPDSVGEGALMSVRIERLDAREGGPTWSPARVWSAPADPSLPGRSFYLLIDKAQGLASGERLRVTAHFGSAESGALVPGAAVIIAEGRTWLYVEEKSDYFVRQAIDLSRPLEEGYFLAAAVKPGERVVVDGAGLLLAREIGTED